MKMQTPRCLIVNADDFGLCETVNQGVIIGHERGIVSSTSLMVRHRGAAAAAEYARATHNLSVGLHIDLGEWMIRQGEWVPVYSVVPVDSAQAVHEEVLLQCDRFRELVGRDPSHLDSHQHVHRREPVRTVMKSVARQLSIPLRHETSRLRYCGDFYGQQEDGKEVPDAIHVKRLVKLITELPGGVTELACHPAAGAVSNTMYDALRQVELQTLCAPIIRAAIESCRISLISFSDWKKENA